VSPLDLATASVEGAGTVLDRVELDRVTDFVGDVAVADIVSTVASAVDRASDQAASLADYGQRVSRTSRVAIVAAIVLLAAGAVFAVRRRKRNVDDADPASSLNVA
jgi:Flp pilus assembly CpaF family ATPase